MAMIVDRVTSPPMLAWSWSIAYKAVALHLKKQQWNRIRNTHYLCFCNCCIIVSGIVSENAYYLPLYNASREM
jgi:hypothetical protein